MRRILSLLLALVFAAGILNGPVAGAQVRNVNVDHSTTPWALHAAGEGVGRHEEAGG